MNFNNISELAEAWVNNTMSQADKAALQARMEADAEFAIEFNEHIALIQALNGNGSQKRFRNMLKDIAREQAAPVQKKKIIQLPAHFWRTSAVAASVALLTSFLTYTIISNTSHKPNPDYSTISREVDHLKREQQKQQATQNAIMDSLSRKNAPASPVSDARYSGTGFALTNDGYFVTASHVVNNGDFDSVYILNKDGQYYKAFLVNFDSKSDIAILKVEKKNFRFGKLDVPYALQGEKASLGTRIFTLSYPNDDAVYSEGYISCKNGYDGDDKQYTLQLPAGHGQSGSPVLDEDGQVLGILTAISSPGQANTYAVGTESLNDLLQKMPPGNKLHLAHGNKLGRQWHEQQISELQNYTFSVKVYKK